jgi:2-dehydro-3-deoxygluconokinase
MVFSHPDSPVGGNAEIRQTGPHGFGRSCLPAGFFAAHLYSFAGSRMAILNIKPADSCNYDLVALGEIMLRLDPGEGRVRNAREFKVWEGGGEYNVARGLRRCFGLRTAVCTAFAENDIGRLIEDFTLQGGVDTEFIKWVPYDGVGRAVRNGLNFTERGFGIRGALGIPDRGNSAASQLKPGDFDWDLIFGKVGVRWFHTGGIFAALSDTTPALLIEAVQAAKKHGTIVSYDLNYRPSLWKGIGGQQRAREVNREIAKFVDVMIGNEEDFTACLGFEVEGLDEHLLNIDVSAFKKMIGQAVKAYPNFKVVATTLRVVKSATCNDWGAICWADGTFCEAQTRRDLEILDRVGGGDSFASGIIYGFLRFNDPQKAVEYGAAHGALAMTTPGDTSMASLKEVEALVAGGSARAQR